MSRRVYINLINLSERKYLKPNRDRTIKVLFLATVLISLSFGQVVSAQTPNADALVKQGVEDYKVGNYSSAVEY